MSISFGPAAFSFNALRLGEPKHDLKMLLSPTLTFCRMGVQDVSKRIIVVAEHSWQSAILKKVMKDSTEEEILRFVEHGKKFGYERVYDPLLPANAPAARWFHPLFRKLTVASPAQRQQILASLETDFTPCNRRASLFLLASPPKCPGFERHSLG